MEAIYEATHDVEGLGIERGDLVTVRPGHPTDPLIITKRFHRSQLPQILPHLDHFAPLVLPPAVRPSSVRRQLEQRLQPPRPSWRQRLRVIEGDQR